jgi:hypothetical protein
MSGIKDFLSNVWNSIKHIFDKISEEEKKAVHIGVTVVEKIKQFIDTPIADFITDLIPGEVDDEIKDTLRLYLPKVLVELQLTANCVDQTEDPNEIVTCALKTLGEVGQDAKNAFLHDLAALISQAASDGTISWSDSIYLVQWYYDHKKPTT